MESWIIGGQRWVRMLQQGCRTPRCLVMNLMTAGWLTSQGIMSPPIFGINTVPTIFACRKQLQGQICCFETIYIFTRYAVSEKKIMQRAKKTIIWWNLVADLLIAKLGDIFVTLIFGDSTNWVMTIDFDDILVTKFGGSPNCVIILVTNLVIHKFCWQILWPFFLAKFVTKFITEFITKIITKFCVSPNSSPNLSPKSSTNLVTHQIWWQKCHQNHHTIWWITK